MADQSTYTKEDKACTNCKHMVPKSRFWAWFYRTINSNRESSQYLCLTPDRIHSHTNVITGKVTVTKDPRECIKARSWGGYCEETGIHWAPSKEWRNKKENLFKQITADDEK
jgi:hypothetical protein